MAKKMKLNLEDLKVQSFVTSLKKDEKDELKGGKPPVPDTFTCEVSYGPCPSNGYGTGCW